MFWNANYVIIQEPVYDIPIFVILYAVYLLIGLTLALFLFSLIIRQMNIRNNKREEQLKEKYYPIIFEYLEVDTPTSKQDVLNKINHSTFDFYVLEMILKELIDQVEGEDDRKLRELLFIDPIYQRHLKQLNSPKETEQLKACLYFSYANFVNLDIISKLKKLLDHPNRYLAFSSASALMASNNVMVRGQALERISRHYAISEMGLLELLYKFHNEQEDQRDLEAFYLIKIIKNEELDEDNRALLIEGASEMNYTDLLKFLRKALNSDDEIWQSQRMQVALIRSQENMLDEELVPLLLPYLESENLSIQVAATELLNKYHDEKINRKILSQIDGKDELNDYTLLKSFCKEYRDEPEFVISKLKHLDDEYVMKLIKMVQPDLVLSHGS